jgi:NTE family protein
MILNPRVRALFFVFLFLPACFANALTSAQEDDIMRGFLWQRLMNMPKEQRPKIGLTLSAGGMRGFSHIGVLEVLEESGLRADYMSGTSMGCIVSALYISGVPFSRMRALAYNPDFTYLSRDISITGVFKYVLFNELFSSDSFQDFISEEVGGVYYENLPVPLACVSADIKTGEKVVFDNGPLALGVRASMNLPGIFAPVEYRQRYLVDGGVVDYMPVDLVRSMGAQWVLSIFALPDYSRTLPSTILGYIVRTADIRGALITENSEKSADFLLGVRVGDLDFSKPAQTIEAVEIGVRTVYGQLNAIKDNYILFSADYAFR